MCGGAQRLLRSLEAQRAGDAGEARAESENFDTARGLRQRVGEPQIVALWAFIDPEMSMRRRIFRRRFPVSDA